MRREALTREADERLLEVLHRRFNLGHPPAQIAKELGETRNAVIGICHRMLPHIEAAGEGEAG